MIVKCVGCGCRKPDNAVVDGRCRKCLENYAPEPEVETETKVEAKVEVETPEAEVEAEAETEAEIEMVEPVVGITEESHSQVEVAAEVGEDDDPSGPDDWLWSNS